MQQTAKNLNTETNHPFILSLHPKTSLGHQVKGHIRVQEVNHLREICSRMCLIVRSSSSQDDITPLQNLFCQMNQPPLCEGSTVHSYSGRRPPQAALLKLTQEGPRQQIKPGVLLQTSCSGIRTTGTVAELWTAPVASTMVIDTVNQQGSKKCCIQIDLDLGL